MGKLVVSEFVTLDGVMEDPGGSEATARGGWAFEFERGAEGDQYKVDELFASDALLLGRVTYEGFAAAWPGRTDEAGFADKFNSMPKYVVSATLPDPLAWQNSTAIRGNVAEEVARLKERYDYIMVNGSTQLVQALADYGLVDEYRLMVFPIVLGSGKRLFGESGQARTLRLVESRPVGPDGVVVLTYAAGSKGA
jgi:dihydrofolate reductase